MKSGRWTAVSQSAFEWEREALDFLREHLLDREPWRAWSNFEFIDDEGRVNEVDVLVFTPVGFILIEVKSRPGTLRGDAYSWTWTTEGRPVTTDNPLPLCESEGEAPRICPSPARGARPGSISRRALDRAAYFSLCGSSASLFSTLALINGLCCVAVPSSPDDAGVIGTLIRADELGLSTSRYL